jgi:hypothetical protein
MEDSDVAHFRVQNDGRAMRGAGGDFIQRLGRALMVLLAAMTLGISHLETMDYKGLGSFGSLMFFFTAVLNTSLRSSDWLKAKVVRA